MRAVNIAGAGDEVSDPLSLMRRAAASASRFLSLLTVTAAALVAPAGPAALAQVRQPSVPALVTPGEMKSGALLLKSNQDGRYVEAPRLGTDIELSVSGPTVRARLTQIFHNPTEGWVEAVYVYPMSEGGAVDTLKMVIGDRIVIGEIRERQEAKVIYERAKAAGQKATLVEQERPNIFTNSVANIGPGESVLVQIEYQEPVRQSGDEFSLRVPLVVGPRYNPAPVVQTVEFSPQSQGWGQVSDPVPDRSRIEPPVLDPAKHSPVNPVSIFVRLQAGFPLGVVKSHHHQVRVENDGEETRLIRLDGNAVPADRDFELTWRPAASQAPSVGLFRERVGDADYLLAFVTPPALAQDKAEDARPREIIFVIDNSGSMGGTSMAQAKASLLYALGRLKPTDRFNVIRLDDTMDVLFRDTVPGDVDHIYQARAFVSALEARGGTEMLPPLKAALTDPRAGDASFLRQVVFITDGAVGNEQQLFDTITAMRGRSRVFMVGIGSAPNSFLMNRAAELGRGTFTHIGSTEQVDTRMRALFEKLESPVVTNLQANLSGPRADMTPAMLPDIYRGEPLVLAARIGSLSGTLEVKGMVGDQPWIVRLPVANAAEGQGLSKVWARRKIADAEVLRTLRRLGMDEADKQILALALEHGLVTRLTSLVAVDKTPSRPEGARLTRAELPLNLPAGWEFDKVFRDRAPLPRPDATETRRADADDMLRLAAAGAVAQTAKPVPMMKAQGGVQLPKTATDAELRMLFGLLFLMASLLLLALRRMMRTEAHA